MRNFKIISVFVLALLVFSGCNFEQRKIISGAKKFIKNEYIPLLHDHKSYELAKIEITDTVFVSDLLGWIDTLEETNKNLDKSYKEVLDLKSELIFKQRDELMARRSTYRTTRRLEETQEKLNEIGKQASNNRLLISGLRDMIKIATQDSIVYYSISHEFRAKNRMGGVILDEHEILYFPKVKSYSIK